MTTLFKFGLFVILSLISVAFITLYERKILSSIGIRLGPFKSSFLGFLQPIFDAGKLSAKQLNSLSNYSMFFYYFSSFVLFIGSLFLWTFISFDSPICNFKLGFILIMCILSVNALMSIVCGWSTFSKYSLLGSVRTLAQLISYEAVLYLCLFFLCMSFMSFSFYSMLFLPFSVSFLLFPFSFYIWIPTILAEMNRTPYDFSEGESELVSGFNTEFGSSAFTLIFLSEYSNIIFFSLISSLLFFFCTFQLYFFLFLLFIIWIRSVLPRYRFDKLMYLAWKFFIPFMTVMFLVYIPASFLSL